MAAGAGGGGQAPGGATELNASDSEDSASSGFDWGSRASDGGGAGQALRPTPSIVRLGPCTCYVGNTRSQRLPERTCQVLNLVSMCAVVASVCVTVAESYETVINHMSNALYPTSRWTSLWRYSLSRSSSFVCGQPQTAASTCAPSTGSWRAATAHSHRSWRGRSWAQARRMYPPAQP
ncbi:unnamed protein product [Prorocentrum cordatum]|uniref:Uncharacterized protein n=1 Tax=Prorocentrum cordatum TaxID=2364126 RepID=A0ABN9XHB3_9DINO|nr:unnamed protein product [Polarella glacialis]